MKKKIVNKNIVIAGICCITLIEVIALLKGINGALLTVLVGIIAGLAGWTMPQLKTK